MCVCVCVCVLFWSFKDALFPQVRSVDGKKLLLSKRALAGINAEIAFEGIPSTASTNNWIE